MSHPSRLLSLVAAAAVLLPLLASAGSAQQVDRLGDNPDPVLAAVQISQATFADGTATHAVIGRNDVFADNLAATALASTSGAVLYTTGGTGAPIRQQTMAEVQRVLGPSECGPGDPTQVYLAGGTAAVSAAVEQALVDAGYCVARLGGANRIATAILVADAINDPSDTVILARSDEWADAAAVGSWAAATRSRILVTPTDALAAEVAEALGGYQPAEILLMGGTAALSQAVEDAAGEIAPTRRIAGAARDRTAVAIAEQVWGTQASGDYAFGNGYAGTSWAYLFAAAARAAQQGQPILYADADGPTAASQALLDAADPEVVQPIGPAVPPDQAPPAQLPDPDLAAVDIDLEEVGVFDSPMVVRARPDAAELWVAERAGRVRVLGDGRTVLDIADTVSTGGERGLLGMAFSADGRTLYTSSTDNDGDSVIDAFDVVGGTVDEGSRRQLIKVGQPASNHNGGDLHLGPDGHLWWSLGDGGGGNDTYGNGQRPDTLLGTLVRIQPTADGYAIPSDNPWADGGEGAREVWAYGLRNPFRFSFDPLSGDLWVGDVGQGAREEVDFLPAGTGAGANFGWPVYEGTLGSGELDSYVPPVFDYPRSSGNCAITGGVVYRGQAIPELFGGYVYSDFCGGDLRALALEDGDVTQTEGLGRTVDSIVQFATDHDGELYVVSLSGQILKIVPG